MSVIIKVKTSQVSAWPQPGQLKYGELGFNVTTGKLWVGHLDQVTGALAVQNITQNGIGGPIGPTGPVGKQGVGGIPGSASSVGGAGPAGATGPQGPQGPPSFAGAVGPTGPGPLDPDGTFNQACYT